MDSMATIVWQISGLPWPLDAERLSHGNTLITDQPSRLIELDSMGTFVWQKIGLSGPQDAERLANGNTLIAEAGMSRVIEVDSIGAISWQKPDYATFLFIQGN